MILRIERDRGWLPGMFAKLSVEDQEQLLAFEAVEGRGAV
jgi:hypothetical protein